MDVNECMQKSKQLVRSFLPGWNVLYNSSRRVFGLTRYERRLIVLSKPYCKINSWKTIRLVVLHEVAHGLVGWEHAHDKVWKEKCLEIGGDGKIYIDIKAIKLPRGTHIAVCPVCGERYFRVRKPKKTRSCGKCCDVFSPDRILEYKEVV